MLEKDAAFTANFYGTLDAAKNCKNIAVLLCDDYFAVLIRHPAGRPINPNA
ncbi:hypothetical protein HNR39_003148 [Glaciimonas immobilis]|uniref:Uncharacterized protein n=1 Tax=Glaciimonas immobilis TaxID=728004 RepID=A0A840RY21_9BURK|nr:hypothetical protein [Glaciimonas immobilis]